MDKIASIFISTVLRALIGDRLLLDRHDADILITLLPKKGSFPKATHMATQKLSFTRLDQGKPLLNRGTLDQYRLVVVCVKGNVSIKETMGLILKEAIGPDGPSPTLVLGPTAPEDLSTDWTGKVGWITFVDEIGRASCRERVWLCGWELAG